MRQKEEIASKRDDLRLQRNESVCAKEEVSKSRDATKRGIWKVAKLLISANEKVSSMAIDVKSF